jgi:hypothetical protein
MRLARIQFTTFRLTVVIAAFALGLAVSPPRFRILALLPLAVGLPAMQLRSLAEFLVVLSIVVLLVALISPSFLSTHCR